MLKHILTLLIQNDVLVEEARVLPWIPDICEYSPCSLMPLTAPRLATLKTGVTNNLPKLLKTQDMPPVSRWVSDKQNLQCEESLRKEFSLYSLPDHYE